MPGSVASAPGELPLIPVLRDNSGILLRLDRFELRIAGHDHQFEKAFKALEQAKLHFLFQAGTGMALLLRHE